MPKNHVRLQAIAFIYCLAFASSARAQDPISPQKRALINELLAVNQAERNIQDSMKLAFGVMEKTVAGMVSKSIPDQLDDRGVSKEAKEQASERTAKSMVRLHESLMKQISVSELVEQVIIPVYDKYYTESELKDLIVFYKTPTGQKSIAVLPQLTGEVMSNTVEYLQPKMEAIIKQMSEELLNELKKNQDGHNSKK